MGHSEVIFTRLKGHVNGGEEKFGEEDASKGGGQ